MAEDKKPWEQNYEVESEDVKPWEQNYEVEPTSTEKKNSTSTSPVGGKVGASATPSIGSKTYQEALGVPNVPTVPTPFVQSSQIKGIQGVEDDRPFIQKAKERLEQGMSTVLSTKGGVTKKIGEPEYKPLESEAITQQQFEAQAKQPTYEGATALDISKMQTQKMVDRSNIMKGLINTKKEAQGLFNEVTGYDEKIKQLQSQFASFEKVTKELTPQIQEYTNINNQITEIKNKENNLISEWNNEYEKLSPKIDAYTAIFQNDKLPEQKRKEAYDSYLELFKIVKTKKDLFDKAVEKNNEGLSSLMEKAKSYDDVIKSYTSNQQGARQLYDEYKTVVDSRNKAAEGLGVYQKRMQDFQQEIKQNLFDQSRLEDVRQNKIEKEYSTLQNLYESLPKMGLEAFAGVVDMLNVLGFTGDQDFPEYNEQTREEVRQKTAAIRKYGESFITQELPKNYEKFFEGDFSIKKLANVAFNGIASTAPTIAAGFIGGPYAAVLAGAGMMFGESKEIMREAGLTEDQADAAAFGLAIPLGLLESYGASNVINLFTKDAAESATKIFLKNIAGKTLTREQLFNEAKNTIGQLIKDGAPEIWKSIFEEGLTEPLQGTVNEIAKQVAQKFTGKDEDVNLTWGEYLKKQAEIRGEEAIGGALGGGASFGGGLILKAGYQQLVPSFNPSAYEKSLELLDPKNMEAFKEELLKEVNGKVITQEQADLALRNIQLIQETNTLIPPSISNRDLRTEALNLLIEKKETQKQIEGKDEALVAPEKERIAEINKRLSDIASGKEEAPVAPSPSTTSLNKNTTPTEERYGTIDRGDGKGIVDLTRPEYEAELAKQGGEETIKTAEQTTLTEERQINRERQEAYKQNRDLFLEQNILNTKREIALLENELDNPPKNFQDEQGFAIDKAEWFKNKNAELTARLNSLKEQGVESNFDRAEDFDSKIKNISDKISEIDAPFDERISKLRQTANKQEASPAVSKQGEVKPMVTEVQFTTRQRERRDAEIEEVQQLRNDLGQDVELINDLPGFIDDVVDRIDLGMVVAPEMLSDAVKELDKQFDKLQAYRNDPSRTHTTAQIDAMIDVLGSVKSEIQEYQLKEQQNGQETTTKTEPTTATTESVETRQEVSPTVEATEKKAEIERRRQEELKRFPTTIRLKKFVADGDNTELTERQIGSVEKAISKSISEGNSAEETVAILNALGFMPLGGNETIALTNYIKDRIEGKDNTPYNEIHGQLLDRINAKYDAELAALEGEQKTQNEQLLTPNTKQNEAVNENVREIVNGQENGQKGDVSQEAKSSVQEEGEKNVETEGGVTAPSTKTQPNEKVTEKENGEPLPEGVQGVRTETEERQTSSELRPNQEEVTATINNAVAKWNNLQETTKKSEQRQAAKEYREAFEKMPTVKNVFDNIKTIFAQLEKADIIKTKNCP